MSFFSKLFKNFNKNKGEIKQPIDKVIINEEKNISKSLYDNRLKDNTPLRVIEKREPVLEEVKQPELDNRKKLYEVIEKEINLHVQEKSCNLSFLHIFKSYNIDGFSLINEKERIVGCYYRKENIDEFLSTISVIENPKFELFLEKEKDNAFDENAPPWSDMSARMTGVSLPNISSSPYLVIFFAEAKS